MKGESNRSLQAEINIFGGFMKKIQIVIFLMGLLCSYSLWAQEGRLQISHLDKLAAKAGETVDVNLDGALLQTASKFLSGKNPGEAPVKDLIAGLKGIYVKSFEFENEGEYSPEDLAAIRNQIQGPQWARMVGVRSKKDKEEVDIYLRTESGKVSGLVILCAEPKELTVVNIVGSIDLDKLSALEGQFGIPEMDLEKAPKKAKE
jgi:hypothetical protein